MDPNDRQNKTRNLYIIFFSQIFVIQSRKIVFNAGMQEGDQMEIH